VPCVPFAGSPKSFETKCNARPERESRRVLQVGRMSLRENLWPIESFIANLVRRNSGHGTSNADAIRFLCALSEERGAQKISPIESFIANFDLRLSPCTLERSLTAPTIADCPLLGGLVGGRKNFANRVIHSYRWSGCLSVHEARMRTAASSSDSEVGTEFSQSNAL